MLYEKSKEYSDIPNPLGVGSSSPAKGSPSKKRSAATGGSATPSKHNSSTSVVVSDDDDSASGSSASTLATPVKQNTSPVKRNTSPVKRNTSPVKRDTSHDADESPSKKRRVSGSIGLGCWAPEWKCRARVLGSRVEVSG